MDNFKRTFKQFDIDYSGCIDKEELELLLPHIGERLTDTDMEHLYFHFDKDQSGELDFQVPWPADIKTFELLGQECVMLFQCLKKARLSRKGRWERWMDRRAERREEKRRPRLNRRKVDASIVDADRKLGDWQKVSGYKHE